MADQKQREVLFEFVQQGRYVKVMAIDTLTKTEVVVVGSAGTSPDSLKQVALNKLRFVLNRANGQPAAPTRRDDNLY